MTKHKTKKNKKIKKYKKGFAKEAHVSARSGRWIMPRTFMGIPLGELGLVLVPYWIQRLIVQFIIKLTFGSYAKYGLPTPNHPVFVTHPTVNSDLIHKLALQRITAHPGIDAFLGISILSFFLFLFFGVFNFILILLFLFQFFFY